MNDKYDTPQGLEPDSKGVNDWVRFQLVRIFDRTRAIENKMIDVCAKNLIYDEFLTQTKIRLAEGVQTFQSIDQRLISIEEQIKELRAIRANSKNPKDGNSITFQWVLEKLALPVIMFLIGGAVTLLFK